MLALTVGLLKCFCGRMVGGATMRPGKRTRIISELDWSSGGSRLRRWITAVTAAVLISVPAVAQTGAYPGQLPVGKECDTNGEAPYNHPTVTVGSTGVGVGIAATDLAGGANVKNLILVWRDGSNFIYRVAGQVQGDGGTPGGFGLPITVGIPTRYLRPIIGIENMSATVADIDGNGTPDLIILFSTVEVIGNTTTGKVFARHRFVYGIAGTSTLLASPQVGVRGTKLRVSTAVHRAWA